MNHRILREICEYFTHFVNFVTSGCKMPWKARRLGTYSLYYGTLFVLILVTDYYNLKAEGNWVLDLEISY